MLLWIRSLTAIDTYRDGGSLSISFVSFKGIEHTLLFPVQRPFQQTEPHKIYEQPILEVHRKTKVVSHITGIARYERATEKLFISWRQASWLLTMASWHLKSLQSDYLCNFPTMVEISKNKGVVANVA